MFAFVFGAFGLIIGSFLNVFILRKGVRSLAGRSACMSCGRTILWQDLIPVVSWIFLRGKCRHCGSAISPQYPLVEIVTGVLFALIGAAPFPIGLFQRVLFCVLAALLVAIAVYDMRHTIIPDEWAYTFG
ncbi:MAG: type 4 prepilin-like protein leader peptide-processing enzyme, partial [Candidatus Parcubacteria bacterium]